MPKGGTVTPISQGLIARALGAMANWTTSWFGPLQPIAPVAPEEVRGRQFDYPVGVNLVLKPRGEQSDSGIDFATLRAVADPVYGGLDLLRVAIETRKDQMAALAWSIQGRDGVDAGALGDQITQCFRRPDLVHTFQQWQRMLVEDLLVIDAPTVYLAPSSLGYRIPQVMDGGTIKLLSQADGRTPLPPAPTFQQILKGLPAVNYTLDEIVYMPRNLRSHKFYGMSPVEQVVGIINVAMRRQTSQLEYYTAGSVPDVVFSCPPEWTADQIASFQAYWDSILSGNTEERRRARFVPGGVASTMLKPDQLKDLFDEWLARIICYCFSLPPTALVKETNRATAQTTQEAAKQEGLVPLKAWWKDLIDCILEKAFNAPQLELVWAEEEITDPTAKADVFSTALGKGGGKPWLTQDEVRTYYGKEPMTAAQKQELQPAPPPVAAPFGGPPGTGGPPSAAPQDGPPKPPPGKAKKLYGPRIVKIERDDKGTMTQATITDEEE